MNWFGIDLSWAYGNLLPMIFQQTRCHHSACDVLHDALLRFALLDNPSRIQQPHAYLRNIVKSVIVDDHRRMARFVALPTEEFNIEHKQNALVFQNTPALQQNFAPSAEHLADLNQRLAALQVIISALPEKCRQVFWLYRIDGLTQPEISTQIGITVKTVEAHLARAMVSLCVVCQTLLD